MKRREILAWSVAAGAVGLMGGSRIARAAATGTRFSDDPFTLGVASGWPTSGGVVLWTRLAPEPLAPGGGLAAPFVPVEWELATDEKFRDIARRGTAYATPDYAYSVHVELSRLEPGRSYWYRFTAGGARSPTGRTHTAPAANAPLPRLRFAVASCQQYEHGWYAAYRHMLDDELDFVMHLGDYLYEEDWGVPPFVRRHPQREIYTLDDYRAQYALYKGDPDLQRAHAACPWLVTWDDHEVENDYGADESVHDDDPAWFRQRREAAYQAYYEHMPLPGSAVPFGASLRLYSQSAFGDLASVYLLDERQYRSARLCRPPPGGRKEPMDCPALLTDAGSMLGDRQERWFARMLAQDSRRWTLLGQGVVFSHLDEGPGEARRYWTDSWNGYPASRQRLLDALADRRAKNPVVFSGDIHTFMVGSVNARPEELSTPVVASEFVTSSISSQGLSEKKVQGFLDENPNIALADSRSRGYLRVEVTPEALKTDLIAIDDALRADSGRRTLASFVVEDGEAGPQRA